MATTLIPPLYIPWLPWLNPWVRSGGSWGHLGHPPGNCKTSRAKNVPVCIPRRGPCRLACLRVRPSTIRVGWWLHVRERKRTQAPIRQAIASVRQPTQGAYFFIRAHPPLIRSDTPCTIRSTDLDGPLRFDQMIAAHPCRSGDCLILLRLPTVVQNVPLLGPIVDPSVAVRVWWKLRLRVQIFYPYAVFYERSLLQCDRIQS